MKRRGGRPVSMLRTSGEARQCPHPDCLRTMRLTRCPDHNVDTVALVAAALRPVALEIDTGGRPLSGA